MKKLLSAFAAIGLAATFALPLSAAPIFVPRPENVQTGTVEQVNHRSHRHWHADRRWDRRWDRRQAWRSCGYYGRCYPRQYGYLAATVIAGTMATMTHTATNAAQASRSTSISSAPTLVGA